MGVFGALFGCRGDGGFSGPLLWVCRGDAGFNVAMLSRLVRDIRRPAQSDTGASAKKFAQHTKNGPKWVLYGALGEPLRGNAAGAAMLVEYFRGPAVVGPRRASLLRRAPGSRAHLLAPLTLQCAAKPYGWHGGQPAQATYRVNVRIKGAHPHAQDAFTETEDGPEGLAGLPTIPMPPRRRQRRDPEGSRPSLRTVTAPSAPKSHPSGNT